MSPFWRQQRGFRLPWRTGDQIRSEVDEELAFHLDMRTAELVREGLSPAAARAPWAPLPAMCAASF